MTMPVLLPLALLLLAPGILAHHYGPYSISLLVMDSVFNTPNMTYTTEVAYRGILIGAMRRIQESNNNFTFTYKENSDYGPYLLSVNGIEQNPEEFTYWELLVRKTNGRIIRPDVGIGCYIPKPNEQVILRFTKWK